MPHLLCCSCENIFVKLLKLPFLQKFRDTEISQYTVVHLEADDLLEEVIITIFIECYQLSEQDLTEDTDF